MHVLIYRMATHSNVVHLLKESGPSPLLVVSSNPQCSNMSGSVSQSLKYTAEVMETKESFMAFKQEVGLIYYIMKC